jgi:predicted Zn-dependent protease
MDELLRSTRALACAIRDRVASAVDDVEVSVSCTDSTGYTVENDAIVAALECGVWSVAMRALKGGALATAATTSRDPGESADALLRALSAAQPDPLERFAALEAREDLDRAHPETWALVDDPAALRASAVALRDGVWGHRKGVVVEAEVVARRVRKAFVTGQGGPITSAETSHQAFVMLDGNDWDQRGARAPLGAEVADLGRALVASLPEREVGVRDFLDGPGEVDAVLHPRLFESLLRALLIERLGADRVLAGLSRAAPGDVIASREFNLDEDGNAAGSLAGHACDDEGVACGGRALVREGRIVTLLADRRTARRAGTQPTGNGYRIPILAESRAEAPVRVGFGHLEVSAGTIPRAALTAGRAVLITDLLGIHSANKSTGAFNNPIVGGLALEDGVPVARLKAGAWSATGNFFELLQGARRMSQERLATGTALLPWVVGRVRVA